MGGQGKQTGQIATANGNTAVEIYGSHFPSKAVYAGRGINNVLFILQIKCRISKVWIFTVPASRCCKARNLLGQKKENGKEGLRQEKQTNTL